jgi:hypothetical protein
MGAAFSDLSLCTQEYADGSIFKGQCRDGRFHGAGSMTWKNGDEVRDTYVGQFECGYMHGQGTYSHASGGRYQGQFARSQRSGYGVFTFVSGVLYEGKWKIDVPEGDGRVIYPHGEIVNTTFTNGEQDFMEDDWRMQTRSYNERKSLEDNKDARIFVRAAMDKAKQDPEGTAVRLQRLEADQAAKAVVPPPPPPPLGERPPPGSGLVALQSKGALLDLPPLPATGNSALHPSVTGHVFGYGPALVNTDSHGPGVPAMRAPPLPPMARLTPPPPPLQQRVADARHSLALADAPPIRSSGSGGTGAY